MIYYCYYIYFNLKLTYLQVYYFLFIFVYYIEVYKECQSGSLMKVY